jgi:hypothetical protein
MPPAELSPTASGQRPSNEAALSHHCLNDQQVRSSWFATEWSSFRKLDELIVNMSIDTVAIIAAVTFAGIAHATRAEGGLAIDSTPSLNRWRGVPLMTMGGWVVAACTACSRASAVMGLVM